MENDFYKVFESIDIDRKLAIIELKKNLDDLGRDNFVSELFSSFDELIRFGKFSLIEKIIRIIFEEKIIINDIKLKLDQWKISDQSNLREISKKFLSRLNYKAPVQSKALDEEIIINKDELNEKEKQILSFLSSVVLDYNIYNKFCIIRLKPQSYLLDPKKSLAILSDKDTKSNIGQTCKEYDFQIINSYGEAIKVLKGTEAFNFLIVDLFITEGPLINYKEVQNRLELFKLAFERNIDAEYYEVGYTADSKSICFEISGVNIYCTKAKPNGNLYIVNQILTKILDPNFIDKELNQADRVLIMSLLPTDISNYRYEKIKSGFSGTLNLLVEPIFQNKNSGKVHVFKIGSSEKIKKEFDNYENFIEPTQIHPLKATMKLFSDFNRAAIKYEFAQTFQGASSYSLKKIYKMTEDDFAYYFKRENSLMEYFVASVNRLFEQHLGSFNIRKTQMTVKNTYLFEDYIDIKRIELFAPVIIPDLQNAETIRLYSKEINNPIKYWMKIKDKLNEQIPLKTVHGDLHTDNVMIDSANNIFLIDYGKAKNKGHLFLDYVMLEISIKLDLISRSIPYDELIRFEESILDPQSISLTKDYKSKYEEINNCRKIIEVIRKNAALLANNYEAEIKINYCYHYYLALFCLSFAQLAYTDMNQQYALISAGLLTDILEKSLC